MNKYGLIGHHLSHSYSPLIHQYIFEKNNINATYELIEVEEFQLEDCVNNLKNNIYKGYNVTIPYKEKIMKFCDVLTDAAKEIGAVNTIYMKDGLVVGDNTDYLGFSAELKTYDIRVFGKDIYVLGSGGASKAICYSIKQNGGNPVVVSTKGNGLSYQEFKEINHYDLIVNTTPVGMFPNVGESVIEQEYVLKADVCVDLIFNPPITKFLSYSKRGYNGLLMLIYQAIYAEELWQNSKVDYDLEELLNSF